MLVPEFRVAGVRHAKKFDAPERYRAAPLTRQADRPIHRMPDEAAREDQPLRVEMTSWEQVSGDGNAGFRPGLNRRGRFLHAPDRRPALRLVRQAAILPARD